MLFLRKRFPRIKPMPRMRRNQIPSESSVGEWKMSEEDISERMNAILNLCEMNPDAGLELIEQAIKKNHN